MDDEDPAIGDYITAAYERVGLTRPDYLRG